MEHYLVGGAVRDKLLGLSVSDRDWVVVGETPDAMIKAGYLSVGKDFPVFLHPETHEEYALARTERKTGPGYHGFEFDTAASVTLDEDLSRRDLTINAIAEDQHGNLIDPYNGVQDIENKLLRHVAPAFAEDPVRILRIAKFMARFSNLGFSVEKSTQALIRGMVSSGEVDNLVAERVWKELEASLRTNSPRAFFTTMHECGALERVVPELAQLALMQTDDQARPDYLALLDTAATCSDQSLIRFAAMCSAFGPSGDEVLQAMCTRLRVPSAHTELALLCARYSAQLPTVGAMDATQIHQLLKSLDVTRRPERFDAFLVAAKASNNIDADAPNQLLSDCAQAMASIDAGKIAKAQTDKAQIPVAIRDSEIEAIEQFLASR